MNYSYIRLKDESSNWQGKKTTLVSHKVPDPLDISRYGFWSPYWIFRSGSLRFHQLIERRNHFDSYCHWSHLDDVSSFGEGSV